ncbi:beta-galactosidase 3-like protein [Tanacetum coccineum]
MKDPKDGSIKQCTKTSFFCYFKNIGGHYESWETRVLCPVVLYGLDQGKQDSTPAKWSFQGEVKDVVSIDSIYSVEWMEGSLIAQKKKPLTWHKLLDSEFSAGEIRAIIVLGNPAPIAYGVKILVLNSFEDTIFSLRSPSLEEPLCYPKILFGSGESHQKKNIDLAYGVPGFVDAFRPLVFGLSSSEYNNNLGNLGNYQGSDGGPRSTIGAAGSGELRAEQPQILQHLKEREWQL